MDQRTQLFANAVADRITSLRGLHTTSDTKHTRAWDDYGYPTEPTFDDYYRMSERFGIASAGLMIPVEQCWKTSPKVREGSMEEYENRDDSTPIEKEIEAIFKSKKLWRKLKLADEYQRVGSYGAFVVQVSGGGDVPQWDKPLNTVTASQLVKFIPLYESQLDPSQWDSNVNSPRFGQPTMYQFQESDINDGQKADHRNRAVNVHYSRVIVFAEGADEDSIYGRPALKRGFNDLITLEKIIGACGEGFWKSAAMKTVYTNTNKDAPNPTPDEIDGMGDAIKDFVEGLDQYLMTGNLDPKVLNPSMANPKDPFTIALNSFAASVQVAAKLLIGNQEGRLAGDQDGMFTLSNMQSRRESWCTQMMESVMDWLMVHGVIKTVEYSIEWDDLLSPSDMDKLSLAEKMSNINKGSLEEVFSANEMRMISGYQNQDAVEEYSIDEGDEDLIDED